MLPLRKPPGTAAATLLIIVLLATGLHPARTDAQTDGTSHTLTRQDNGTTITVPVGDIVALRLGTDFDYSNNVRVTDTNVLRPLPLALVRGVQGVWRANATGSATISAIGVPICPAGMACIQIVVTFSATVIVVPTGAPPPVPGTVTYQPGWNIVGGPAGMSFPLGLYGWDPSRQQYTTLPPNTPIERGRGYWAFFNQQTTLQLPGDQSGALPFQPGGQFVLIGNPFGAECAGINIGPPQPPGSPRSPFVFSVYTYDPQAGQYSGGTSALLKPGQGAWVVLDSAGTVPLVRAGAPGANGLCIAPP